jgi:hypothetical protein
MLPCHPQAFRSRQQLRLGQRLVIKLVKNNPFLADVREEVVPLLQLGIHLTQRMYDELRRCLDEAVPNNPVGRLVPVGRMVRQFAIIDDHQQIEIRAVAFHRMRLIDKRATGIGTKQDDLKNASALLEVGCTFVQRILELLMQDLQRTGELSLFSVRDMIEGGFHHGNGVSDWLPIVAAILWRWWYPWTLYASQHSSNGKSASRLLEVQMWLGPTLVPDVVYRSCNLLCASSPLVRETMPRPFDQTN